MNSSPYVPKSTKAIGLGPSRDETPLYLTRHEAARFLNVSPKTLASHLHDGPRFHKFFGAVRYARADLEEWARQQRT